MAFDISLEESPRFDRQHTRSFADFFDENVDTLGRALGLACDDQSLAADALSAALAKTSQQWKRIAGHPQLIGWVFHAGIAAADKTLGDHQDHAVSASTGGYVRGLDMTDALAALPLQQRAVLVAAYFLGLDDDQTAAGFGAAIRTIRTRRSRALGFVAHHLRLELSELHAPLVAHFVERAAEHPIAAPEVSTVRRRGRRRTMRNALGAGVLAAAAIAGGGALFQAGGTAQVPQSRGPEPVAAPTNSVDWFDPVSNGRGGFISLNVRGASRFALSTDGVNWFSAAVWNSRAINVRTEVTRFERTADGYLATVEAQSSVRDFVAPFVATSPDLQEWDVREVTFDVPPDVAGLRTDYQVRGAAVRADRVLVAIGSEVSLDYRFHGLRPNEICAESGTADQITFFLCDQSVLTIDRPESQGAQRTRYFLATGDAPFRQVALPVNVDPRTITATGSGFAAVDSLSGEVTTSQDGERWAFDDDLPEVNRQVLLESDGVGPAMLVVPDPSGWSSLLLDDGEPVVTGTVPISLDPAVVWTKPELAAGPAGWALFVTTSRPWERSDVTPGWAVDTGDWIVTRQPDSPLISARTPDGALSYRYLDTSESVEIAADGTVTLFVPGTSDVLITVEQAQITASRTGLSGAGSETALSNETAATSESAVKAQVLFSADGVSWRPIWTSDTDAWFGSLAVGDDEVLLTGARLVGPPIRIPIDQ